MVEEVTYSETQMKHINLSVYPNIMSKSMTTSGGTCTFGGKHPSPVPSFGETLVYSVIPVADIELLSDPFDMSEADPAKCGALESCLWELKVGWCTTRRLA